MRYRTRTYYTDAQKALMWERWKEGWTLSIRSLSCSIEHTRRCRESCPGPVAFGRRPFTAETVS
jgi:hypothetical protein